MIPFAESNGGARGWCDEYPFASSKQGGPANFAAGKVSLRMVPEFEQRIQAGQLSAFYGWAGVAADGNSEESRFLAIAIPGMNSFMVNRRGEVYRW